jgi:phosphatidylinositol glycan class A protein
MSNPPQQLQGKRRRCYRIAMVSDFFYPRLGGVENHIYSLAHELIRLGHHVVVITHAYRKEGMHGVHFLHKKDNHGSISTSTSTNNSNKSDNGTTLKVYYCPIVPMVDEDSLPTFTATLPLLRWIWHRERIDLVHAHQATSTLANESVVYACALGWPAVYTDHSLFNLHDLAGIILGRVQTTTLATVDAAIGVSRACRTNLQQRTQLDDARLFVVTNGVAAHNFLPDPSKRRTGACGTRITVVVVSRLAYRKGVDLLMGILPDICHTFAQVNFLVAGDGNKRVALQEVVASHGLEERVTFLGALAHAQVRDVLVQGHIFLNCSLTESFCIAILEAACAGLAVVTTNVGGIPEVLPDDLVILADPTVPAMVQALRGAIQRQAQLGTEENISSVTDTALANHARLASMYSWQRVATETLQVYDFAVRQPRKSLVERLECYTAVGLGGIGLTAFVVAWLAVTLELWANLVVWLQPARRIDVLPLPNKVVEPAMVDRSKSAGVDKAHVE